MRIAYANELPEKSNAALSIRIFQELTNIPKIRTN